MYEIDKGVPMPGKRSNDRCRYPFRTMEVGDSFLVPFKMVRGRRIDHYAVNEAASRFRRRNPGYSFNWQLTDEGIRVWRV